MKTYRHRNTFATGSLDASESEGDSLYWPPQVGHRILIVDDSRFIQLKLSKLLSREGFNVDVAENGKQAIAKSLDIRPHLILMDINMPVMNGWEATHRIRLHPKLTNTLVVILSASSLASDMQYAFECGAHSYLVKPIADDLLVAHIQAALAPKTEQQPIRTGIEDCCILVVDDSGMIRTRIQRVLGELGCELIEAKNGEQAVWYAFKHRPDLILMDINMPVMDGWEAARRIRNNRELYQIPIFAVTANTLQKDVEKAVKVGMDGYIVKPFSDENLLQRVAQFLIDRVLDAQQAAGATGMPALKTKGVQAAPVY